jgi:hypothetical protein
MPLTTMMLFRAVRFFPTLLEPFPEPVGWASVAGGSVARNVAGDLRPRVLITRHRSGTWPLP